MSIFQEVALPTTLTDLLRARDDALRLIGDARLVMQKAADVLAPHGRYLMPQSGLLREDPERTQDTLDASMWTRAFDLTGFKQLMDAQAVAEFERSLKPRPPAFTEANIRSTFIALQSDSREMFRRGVVNVFRYLSDNYKTNSREPFRIGRKVIMVYMVNSNFSNGLQIRYGTPDAQLNDIDRVFQTLDEKKFQANAFCSALNTSFKAGQLHECDTYRARAFKNGNLHMEFKRADLLEKVNDLIAEHYANTLPDARF